MHPRRGRKRGDAHRESLRTQRYWGGLAGLVLAVVIRPGSSAAGAEKLAAAPEQLPAVSLDVASGSVGAIRSAVPPVNSDPSPPTRPVATLHERPASPPSIGALANRVYIHSQPDPRSPEIGALAVGTAVKRREIEPVSRERCRRGWYAIEPEGYVCLDGSTTLDVDQHPLMRAKRHHRGDFSRAAPFVWGKSDGAKAVSPFLPRSSSKRSAVRPQQSGQSFPDVTPRESGWLLHPNPILCWGLFGLKADA